MLFSLLLIMFFLNHSYGQSILLKLNDGSSYAYSLNDIKKISFLNNVMDIELNDSSDVFYNVSIIQYLKYDNTLGSKDVTSFEKICIYPNPISTFLKINFNLKEKYNVDIALYNQNGSIVALFEDLVDLGQMEKNYDCKHLNNGIYSCIIRSKDFTYKKQILINHK